jgi:hypothetical protein
LAAKGDPGRVFWLVVVGLALLAGGVLSFLGVRYEYEQRLAERDRIEAEAASAGRPVPAGPTAALLRKEIRVIPHLMHIFTFSGVVLLVLALAEHRGWRAMSPVAEQPAQDKGS